MPNRIDVVNHLNINLVLKLLKYHIFKDSNTLK